MANTTETLLTDTLEPVTTGVLGPVANTTDTLLTDTLEPVTTGVVGPSPPASRCHHRRRRARHHRRGRARHHRRGRARHHRRRARHHRRGRPVTTGVVEPVTTDVVEVTTARPSLSPPAWSSPSPPASVEPVTTGVVGNRHHRRRRAGTTGVVAPHRRRRSVTTDVVTVTTDAVDRHHRRGRAPVTTGVVEPVTNTTDPLLAQTVLPAVAAVEPITGVGDPVTGPIDPIAAVEPLTETVQPVVGAVEPLPAPIGDDAGGSMWTFPFDGLAGGTPGAEEVLIISALAAAGATALQARFFLANVPPIPLTCMVGEATVRYMSALTSTASVNRAASATAGVAGRVGNAATELGSTVRDGFMRGAGQIQDGADDEAVDTRLLMQLGMVLGTVYLAFLTVWFWATRLRWSPRS